MNNANAKKLIKFSFEGEPKQEVYVAGSFNNWNPAELKMREVRKGIYWKVIELFVGRYEYKFVVNGIWCIDPNTHYQISNEEGSLNSIIVVM